MPTAWSATPPATATRAAAPRRPARTGSRTTRSTPTKAAETKIAEGRIGDPQRGRQKFAVYVIEQWLPNHVIEVSTRQGYTYQIGKHLIAYFGEMRMIDISSEVVREWITECTATGMDPKTLLNIKNILSRSQRRRCRSSPGARCGSWPAGGWPRRSGPPPCWVSVCRWGWRSIRASSRPGAAFTCFVLSIVIVGGATWNGARRPTPEWLVDHVARRALRSGASRPGRRRDLSREVAVLGDLVGSSRLPVAEHRLAAVTWSVALAAGLNAVVEADDVARSVREVGADLGRETAPVHQAAVVALAALGVRLSWSEAICEAVLDVLFDLAMQDRAAGRHQVAAEALDGVAEVVVARLVHVMTPPDVLAVVELPAWPDKPAPAPRSRASRFADGALTPRVVPPARPQLGGSAHDQVRALTREPADVDTVSWLLSTLVPGDLSARFPSAAPAAGFDAGYELLESTVNRLLAVLASPRPASIGWSGGHHEAGSFGADVERLTRIGRSLYTQRRYSRCDAIERTSKRSAPR
jgi:hypothetical protein